MHEGATIASTPLLQLTSEKIRSVAEVDTESLLERLIHEINLSAKPLSKGEGMQKRPIRGIKLRHSMKKTEKMILAPLFRNEPCVRLSLNYLKIDMQLIRNIDSDAMKDQQWR